MDVFIASGVTQTGRDHTLLEREGERGEREREGGREGEREGGREGGREGEREIETETALAVLTTTADKMATIGLSFVIWKRRRDA